MRDKTIDLNAQAGSGVRAICDAIHGLKAWKREYKEQTGMDLDISGNLKAIRSNLKDLMQIAEEDKEEEEFYAILNRCSGVSK